MIPGRMFVRWSVKDTPKFGVFEIGRSKQQTTNNDHVRTAHRYIIYRTMSSSSSAATVEPVRCLLNGNGRIGRLVLRYTWEDPLLDVVQINDICSCASAAYLIQYDSVHGTWDKDVQCVDENTISIDGKQIAFSQQKVICDIPNLNTIELVMECTGKFLTSAALQPYLDAGVRQVVVSAPVKEKSVLNVVLGCNHTKFVDQPIITNASCTTNCLAPIVKVILDNFGIVHGCITTIHVRMSSWGLEI